MSRDYFDVYAETYRVAAKQLYEKDSWMCHHYSPLPVMFLYRHAIELYLKSIIIASIEYIEEFPEKFIHGFALSKEKMEEIEKKICSTHNLSFLYKKLKKIYPEKIEEILSIFSQNHSLDEDVEKCIKKINKYDTGSFNFRYPTDKDFQSTMKYFMHELLDFVTKAERICEACDGVAEGMYGEIEAKRHCDF